MMEGERDQDGEFVGDEKTTNPSSKWELEIQLRSNFKPGLDDVDGGGDEGGGEAGGDGGCEVAGDAVPHQAGGDQEVLDHVVHHDLTDVDDGGAGNVRGGACRERKG